MASMLQHLGLSRRAQAPDLEILNTRSDFAADRLQRLVYQIVEREPYAHWRGTRYREAPGYKVVVLRELLALPRPPRDETTELDILARTRTTLRGLYDARIDLAYLGAGFFSEAEPPRLGLVQVYGVVTYSDQEATAIRAAEQADAALVATLANFNGIQTQRLLGERARRITRAMAEFSHVIVMLGQADAAETTTLPASSTGIVETEKPAEQNELFWRGMARIGEDCLFAVLARRVPRQAAARLLEAALHESSQHASRSEGQRTVSFSVALPAIWQRAASTSEQRGHTDGASTAVAEGVAEGTSHTHTEGTAHTDSYSHTTGQAETWGEADTTGSATSSSHMVSVGTSQSTSQGVADGTSHTESHSVTDGASQSTSHSVTDGSSHSTSSGFSTAQTAGFSGGTSTTSGTTDGANWGGSQNISTAVGTNQTHSEGASNSSTLGQAMTSNHTIDFGASAGVSGNVSGNAALGIPGTLGAGVGVGLGANASVSYGEGWGAGTTDSSSTTTGTSSTDTTGASTTVSAGSGANWGESHGTNEATTTSSGWSFGTSTSHSSGESHGASHAETHGASSGTSHAETRGAADGTSHTTSQGTADGVSRSEAWGTSSTFSQAHTTSHAVTRSSADTWGRADTTSQSDAYGVSAGRTYSEGTGFSAADARAFAASLGTSLSTGFTAGVGVGESTRWVDQAQVFMADLWQRIARVADTMAAEGGYEVESYILARTETGARAAEALAIQAFHGLEEVVIPVTTALLSPEEGAHVRAHVATFTPCQLDPPAGIAGVLAGGRYTTANTLLQLAPLVAPAVFEEGLASTEGTRPPDFAYYPDLPGDALLGHQYSVENYTGEAPTSAPVWLDRDSFYSFAIVGDTGTGKTTFGERLVLETTRQWQLRTVVFDFGAGWTRLVHAPGLEEHATSYSLSPFNPNPIRYNPLQTPFRVEPSEYIKALPDLWGGTTGMGPIQIKDVEQALARVYLNCGVLLNEPAVLTHPHWSQVAADEEAAVNAARQAAGRPPRRLCGRSITELAPGERHALGVHRSRQADVAELLTHLRDRLAQEKSADRRAKIDSIISRLGTFAQAEVYAQFRPLRDGEAGNSVDVLSVPWGLTVISGGWGIPEMLKAMLIGQQVWVLANDAAAHLNAVGTLPHRGLHLFIDEMQKLFGGAEGASENSEPGAHSQQLTKLLPDCRKYGIAISVGVQNASLLPIQVLANCNNIAMFRLKHPDDRNVVAEMLGLSSKGFRDVSALSYLATLQPWRCLFHLANHPLGARGQRFMLMQPLRVPARTPSHQEEVARYGIPYWGAEDEDDAD
ncbi:MAG: serine-rich protein [Anaerolineae bacterium]|nr:serine-rich protein [Anaerolineae bacterium]